MKKKTLQQNKDQTQEVFEEVLSELASPPDSQQVSSSFSALMQTVTREDFIRIPGDATQKDVSVLHPKHIMNKITKLSIVAAPTLTVVALVTYMTLPGHDMTPYNDIILQALPAQNYLENTFEDGYEDLVAEDDMVIDITHTSSDTQLKSVGTPPAVEQGAGSVDEKNIDSLLTVEDLFGADDIDDTALNAWFADDSASDALFENYDI